MFTVMNRLPKYQHESDSDSSSEGDNASEYQETYDISDNTQDLFDTLEEDEMYISEETIQKAKQKDPHSLFQIGAAYFDLANPIHHIKGIEWYRMAAELHHPEAQYEMAEAYIQGDGVAMDFQYALHWYRNSAFHKFIKAYFKVGKCYMKGWGCTRNETEGLKWYRKAAKHGDAKAFFCMGEEAEKCVYDPVRRRAAIEYYFMSYTRGVDEALEKLENLMKDKVYTFTIEKVEVEYSLDWEFNPGHLSPTDIMDRLLDPNYVHPLPPTLPPPPPEHDVIDQVVKHDVILVFGRKFGNGDIEYGPYLKDKKFHYF